MRLHYGTVLIALAVLSLVTIACHKSTSAETKSENGVFLESTIAATVLAGDYATLESETDGLSPFEAGILEGVRCSVEKQKLGRALTPGELRRLGIWRLPAGGKSFWLMAVEEARKYFLETGQLPRSAVDIYPELSSDTGTPEDPAEFIKLYCNVIDPITGQLYADYEAEQWAPASMNLEVIVDPVRIAELFPDVRLPRNELEAGQERQPVGSFSAPSEVWRVTIYGEEEGSMVYKAVLYY